MKVFECNIKIVLWGLAIALLPAVLCGCGDPDEYYPANEVYRVTVVNLTYNQYFPPVAVIVHTDGYSAWTLGQPASEAMERLAENGQVEPEGSGEDGEWLLTEAKNDSAVVLTKTTIDYLYGEALGIGGGGRAVVDLSVPADADYLLTVATKLALTNDGFTGVADYDIGVLKTGESRTFYVDAFDAGTEANTETEETLFDYLEDRDDDENFIRLHTGVVTADELTPSGELVKPGVWLELNETYRFQQPVAKIVVERRS